MIATSLLLLTLMLTVSSSQAEPLKLSPQTVVDRVLAQGLRTQELALEEQKKERELFESLGELDWRLGVSTNFTEDRAESLSGMSNLKDQSFGMGLSLGKSLVSGTHVEFGFDRQSQKSELSTFAQNLNLPEAQTQDQMVLKISQNLWKNAFGKATRARLDRAENLLKNASLERLEGLEASLVEAMKQFWSTYVAQENLRESIAAKERYENLVSVVRSKDRVGFTNPGELSRVQAEYEEQFQRVKITSFDYLSAVDNLLVLLRYEPAQEVAFATEAILPALPNLEKKSVETLRPYQIAERELRMAQADLQYSQSRQAPQLDLVGESRFTGVEDQPSDAFAEMAGLNRPTYFIGLQFSTPLEGRARHGEVSFKSAEQRRFEIALERKRDALRTDLLASERHAQAQFQIAESAARMVTMREKAVRELERSYRQGRSSISDVILAYNAFFAAQTKRSRAIGDYHIALNELASLRDELIAGFSPRVSGRQGNNP